MTTPRLTPTSTLGKIERICAAALDEPDRHAALRFLNNVLLNRIYDEVVPPLAQGLIAARKLRRPSAKDLADTYEMALVILFRLLFVAYAEDKELLPYKTNESCRDRSQRRKLAISPSSCANSTSSVEKRLPTGRKLSAYSGRLTRATPEWGVPKYNGGLFSSAPAVSAIGAAIASVRIPTGALRVDARLSV